MGLENYLSLYSPHQSEAEVTGNTVLMVFSELTSNTTDCGELRRQLPFAPSAESQYAHAAHVFVLVAVSLITFSFYLNKVVVVNLFVFNGFLVCETHFQ